MLIVDCHILSSFEHGLKIVCRYNKNVTSKRHKVASGMRIDSVRDLPQKGVIFLGGHQNMTKKLRQHFPRWTFISDEQLKRYSVTSQRIVFYWTCHSSHKLMQYVYSKLPSDASVIYVTATNLPLLIAEMNQLYCSKFKEAV